MRILPLLNCIAMLGTAAGQTAIDLRSQARNVDFSGAVSTKPSKTGTALPLVCSTGETFFKTDALPGANLYLCVTSDVWAQSAPPVGAGQGVQITGNVIATEDAIIPIYYTGAGTPSIACTPGRDFYVNTTAGSLFFCKAANTWQDVSPAGHTHSGGDPTAFVPVFGFRFATIISTGASTTPSSLGDTYVFSGTASQSGADATWGHRINIASGASAGSVAVAGGQALWRAGRNVLFTAFAGIDNAQGVRAHIGLTDASTLANMFGADAPNQKYISFRYLTGQDGSTWKCVARNTGTPEVQDTGVTAAGNQPHWFRIEENGATAACLIDGITVATLSTNVPAPGTNFRVFLGVETTEAVAKTASFGVIQLRSNF